jgi:hypothetical protein
MLDRFYKRLDLKSILIFAAVALFAYLATTALQPYLDRIAFVLLAIELTIIFTIVWYFAAHAVLKSLFGVSAGLSLVIYLAQSYCAVPAAMRTADNALKSLVVFGMIFIGIEFCTSLYKEGMARSNQFMEVNDHKWPWLILILFAIFTGIFVWQVVQVIVPIVNDLCVYKA